MDEKKPNKKTKALLNKIATIPKDIPKKPAVKPKRKLENKPIPKPSADIVRKIGAIKRDTKLNGGAKVAKIKDLLVEGLSSQDTNYIEKQAKTLYDSEKKKVQTTENKVAKLGESSRRKNPTYDFYRGVINK